LHEHRTKFEDSTSLTLEAAVLGRMNRQGEADKLFAKAIEKYRGTSPFGIAWIYFEQGSMLDRAGETNRARELYKKAVEKLPMYAHAVGHLAVLVPPPEGQALLEGVVELADDPEYRALLGGIQEKRHPGAGKALIERAKRGYERAMKELPLAFADHAGWFYLDVVKDVDRAVEVAELNLAARQVPEAFELALAAQVAAGEKDDACTTADRALELKYVTPSVKRRAAAAYAACGKKDRSSELEKELVSKH
jgi:tetratricopeptide (TPR) repeat protein